MLKRFAKLVMSMVVLQASAYASPAYAASADIILSHIQAGGTAAALQEMVTLYNNSAIDTDVTDWCLQNKSAVKFACLTASSNERLILPAYSYAVVGSTAFASVNPSVNLSMTYTPTNQSSGSIVGGNDTISLVNDDGVVVDSNGWTVSLAGGTMLTRHIIPGPPLAYLDSDSATDWSVLAAAAPADSQIIHIIEEDTPCIENCEEIPELESLILTEMLPNAEGSDTGKEFIELYNPNDVPVALSEYKLLYGPELDKTSEFPMGVTVEAKSYMSFTNAEMDYSLLNTSSRVGLTLADGTILDETLNYISPEDDTAWALIDSMWQYTNRPTPGHENLRSIEILDDVASLKLPQPCASNQYRSPETNRCRLIATSGGTVAPCKDNQYRSEETNRCRNIVTASEPLPCKEGQERNSETNRCRTIVSMSKADYGVLGTQTVNDNRWYIWLAVGGLGLLALAYAVWEWRYELGKVFARLQRFVRAPK